MRPERIQRVAAAVLVVAVAIILLRLTGVLSAAFGLASSAFAGLAAPLHGAAVSGLAPSGQSDCPELDQELDSLRLENSRLRTLVSENAALKTALDFRERESTRSVMARVLSQSSDPTFAGLTIDRGSDDGLSAGQPVVVGDGVLVGKVYAVRRRTASVLLLTDSSSRLAVAVQGGSGTLGVLEGNRGITLAISLIPQSERVSPGDMVVTSGLEPGIRAGLVVGTVEKVQRDSQEPFQTANILPFESAVRPILVQVLIPEFEFDPAAVSRPEVETGSAAAQ
ncbi:MAG: rod shape-determining protein MreC [bacterium]